MKTRKGKSADEVILDVLGYEFTFDDRADAERRIKRRLRYHGAGPYRQERVDRLRCFKNEVQEEIHSYAQSRYYTGGHGRYSTMEDFDVERMIRDWARSYTDIHRDEIVSFIPFAVFYYYLK